MLALAVRRPRTRASYACLGPGLSASSGVVKMTSLVPGESGDDRPPPAGHRARARRHRGVARSARRAAARAARRRASAHRLGRRRAKAASGRGAPRARVRSRLARSVTTAWPHAYAARAARATRGTRWPVSWRALSRCRAGASRGGRPGTPQVAGRLSRRHPDPAARPHDSLPAGCRPLVCTPVPVHACTPRTGPPRPSGAASASAGTSAEDPPDGGQRTGPGGCLADRWQIAGGCVRPVSGRSDGPPYGPPRDRHPGQSDRHATAMRLRAWRSDGGAGRPDGGPLADLSPGGRPRPGTAAYRSN
ncbi:hypothetical protein RKD42_008206 [Streptomyces ambofaciens]